jgi:Raf kinase inhibitor-like YbhB/YbcL family protein
MAIVVNAILTIKSAAFGNNQTIPEKYSCNGVNPPIEISGLPPETKSMILIVDDTDTLNGPYDHWIVWNIPPSTKIEENSSPGVQGKNSRDEKKYYGPCPPEGKVHHYHFRIYALDKMLDIDENCKKNELIAEMEGHILATGELVGTFGKEKK